MKPREDRVAGEFNPAGRLNSLPVHQRWEISKGATAMLGRPLKRSFQPMFGLGIRVPLISAAKTLSRLTPLLEQLETRTALAGNVTAAVLGGNLVVTSDNQGADIAISQPRVGKITLTGDGTSINGSAGPVTFSGVTRDLRINFGKGNDSLTFDETNPITVCGNLSINGGQGSNTISTLSGSPGSLTVGRDLNILNQPGGPEQITLLNLSVKRNAQIRNMGGDSLVTIDVASNGTDLPGFNSIGGNLQIVNGPGQYNETDLSSINVKGSVQILNQGNDAITNISSSASPNTIGGNLQIIDGTGQLAQTEIDGTKVGCNLQVAASGPDSNTTLILTSTQVRKDTGLKGGDGDSTVFVNDDTFGGSFQLQTGNGADTAYIGTGDIVIATERLRLIAETTFQNGTTVVIHRPVIDTIEVPYSSGPVAFNGKVIAGLGNGDDILELALNALVKFRKAATFDGQGGYDTALLQITNLPSLPTLKNFESVSLGGGCFVAGTLVATEIGLRPIEEISAGEKVYAYDREARKWILADVIEPLIHTYSGDLVTVLIGSDKIKATGNHPFWVISGDHLADRPVARDVPVHDQDATAGGRWVEARNLRVADTLLRNNGQSVRVDNVYEFNENLIVYNLEISMFHNYSVGSMGVLVHNKVAP